MDIVKFLRDSRAVPIIAAPFLIVLWFVASSYPSEVFIQFFTVWFPASLVAMLPALVAKMPDARRVNLDTIFIAAMVLCECAIIRSHL